jgi:hypothetical protein
MGVRSRREILWGGLAGLATLKAAAAFAAQDPKRRLVDAYPEYLARAAENAIVWRDGSTSVWDDGLAKNSFDEKLANASLADQMSLPYACGPLAAPPALNEDPGRLRNIAFFRKMYGADEASVRTALVEVPWRIGSCRDALAFTRINGVDRIAARIVEELAALPKHCIDYLVPPAGSFNWRPIAGTQGLSPHAFGIAVDINTRYSDYWRWNHGAARKEAIPFEIVDVFERHRFIWGGKWYHYDTMHFEYRPELMARRD